MWQNSKTQNPETQNVTKSQNLKYDKTQKLKIWHNWKLKMWQNSKTKKNQNVKTKKKSKCYKTENWMETTIGCLVGL